MPQELYDLDEDDMVTVQLNEDTVNAAPAFASASVARNVDEDTAPGTSLGAPVTATDADSDPLRYSLGEEPGAASFAIDPASGQLWTALALDHETVASHTFTVRADDGRGGTDTVEVTVTVDDVDEQPARPAAPTVAAAPGSTTALDVAWAEPDLRGGPAITGYKVQRRLSVGGGGGSWTAEDVSGAGTRTTLTGLAADTAYQVRVRALNGETASAWSVPATGSTGSAANTAPAGAPAIDGTAVEGAVLGVDVSGITDEDGLSSPDYAYQWEREAAGVWTGIAGADGGSYRLGAADVGAKLRVRVSFTDDGGTRETLTSAATETVLPFVMTGACPLPDLTGRNEVWRAVLTVGDGWSNFDGYRERSKALCPTPSSSTSRSNSQSLGSLLSTTLRLQVSQKGQCFSYWVDRHPSDTAVKRLRLHVCGEAFDLKDNTLIDIESVATKQPFDGTEPPLVWHPGSNLAVALSETRNTPATGRPSVTGAAVTGQALSADRSAIADADGTTQADAGDAGYAWAYQWVHVDGMTETDIAGATGDTYTPTRGRRGQAGRGAGDVHRRPRLRGGGHERAGRPGVGRGARRDRAARHQRHAAGRPGADHGQGHDRRRRHRARDLPGRLHVPVGAGGGRDGRGHRRRDGRHLHAGTGRRGPPARGGGELHRRRRHGGDARERRDRGGGGGGRGLRGGPSPLATGAPP